MNENPILWPHDVCLQIGANSRVRIRPEKEDATLGNRLRNGTTGFISGGDIYENSVTVCVNPAIRWVGTYQELIQYWEFVPAETPLTF